MTGEIRLWLELSLQVILIVGGLIGFWKLLEERARARAANLRLDDVRAWAIRAIEVQREVALLTGGYPLPKADAALLACGIRASQLVEIGRLFFRNDAAGSLHNRDQPPAYHGHRPLVLDQLIVTFMVCRTWDTASADQRRDLARAAELAARRFLSMIRDEVGRLGTRVPETGKTGKGDPLQQMLAELQAQASGTPGGNPG